MFVRRSSIFFVEDRDGFIIPTVNKKKCINCGRCNKICPALSELPQVPYIRKCYLAYNFDTDVRKYGSSGSVFYALAEIFIKKGGGVYGAAFDNTLQLRHTRATDMQGVKRQMKSKYIQSDTTGIYRQVIQDLRDNIECIFVGTPCQCQALHNIISPKLREKLLIVDIICHGVPSQKLFNLGKRQFEQTHKCIITDFSFREKTKKSLRNYRVEYITTDKVKHVKIGDLDEIPFCYGFFYHYIQRNSCYSCKYRKTERVSDLTLGDFWGISHLKPEIKDIERGYSSVIVNTSKGQDMIDQLATCKLEEIRDGVSFISEHNHAYTKSDDKSWVRDIFFFCLRHFGYAFCEKHFLQQHRSLQDRLFIAVVTRLDNIRRKI